MRGPLILVISLLCAWGCSEEPRCGSGTVERDGVCVATDAGVVADAGADAAVDAATDRDAEVDGGGDPDSGAKPDTGVVSDAGFEPGDILIVDPGSIQVVQGFMLCVGITVRRADSTVVTLDPASIQVELTGPGAAFAALGEPGDCRQPEQFAVIATGPGQGALTFKVGVLTFPASIEVVPAEVRVEAQGPVDSTIGLNRPALMPGSMFVARAYVGGMRVRYGQPVPRYLSLVPVDASIVAIERTGGEDYIFSGLQVGSTELHPRYDGNTGSFVADTGTVQVVAGGTPIVVRTRMYRPGTWVLARPEEAVVGACFEFALQGRYDAGDGVFFSGQATDATFTAPGLTQDAAGSLCIQSTGLLSVIGCSKGVCHTIEFLVPPAQMTGVRLVPSSPPPFVEIAPFRLCPPLDVFVDFADGSSIDVTLSRVYWLEVGVPVDDGMGSTTESVWTERRDPLTEDLDLEGAYRCVTHDSRQVGATIACHFRASVGATVVEQTYDTRF